MSDINEKQSPPSGRPRSIWDNPHGNWKPQLPNQQTFRDPNVSAEELRKAVKHEDKRSRDFATPVTAEALTYTFG